MAQGLLPRFATVTTGSPVTIDTVVDANFQAAAVLLVNYASSSNDALFLQIEGFPGDPIAVAAGTAVRFNGSFNKFSIATSSSNNVPFQFIASAVLADLPDFTSVGGGGGGGGGGGAPTDGKYLLYADTVPGSLTQAESAADLHSPLDLVLPLPTSSPDLTTVWNPARMSINANGDDFLAGGGVKLPFRVLEGSGDHEFGGIAFAKSTFATDLHVTGAAGAQLFDYECVPAVGGEPAGIVMWGGNTRRIAAAGGNDLVVESTNAAVIVKTNSNEVVRFSSAHMDAATGKNLTIQAASTKDLTFVNGGGTAGVNINDDATTPIQVVTAGGGWLFNADGSLTAPGTKITGLATATNPSDAVRFDQLGGGGGAPTNGNYFTWGAPTAGLTNAKNLTSYTGNLSMVASGSATLQSTLAAQLISTGGNAAVSSNFDVQLNAVGHILIGGADVEISAGFHNITLDTTGLLTVPGKITGITAGSNPSDAAIFSQVDAKADAAITIATTSPLTGGGDLSANRTFAIPAATNSVDGYATAALVAAVEAATAYAANTTRGSCTLLNGQNHIDVTLGSSTWAGKPALITIQSNAGTLASSVAVQYKASVTSSTLTITCIDAILGSPVAATGNVTFSYYLDAN